MFWGNGGATWEGQWLVTWGPHEGRKTMHYITPEQNGWPGNGDWIFQRLGNQRHRTKYDWSNKKVCFLSACKCRCYVVDWGISSFKLARANEIKKNHFGSSDGMSRFLLWKVRTLNARDWVTWQSGQPGTQTFSLWLKITTFLLCFWVFCPWFTAIGSFVLWMLSKDSLSLVFSNVYVMCLRVLHLTSPINSPMNIPYYRYSVKKKKIFI